MTSRVTPCCLLLRIATAIATASALASAPIGSKANGDGASAAPTGAPSPATSTAGSPVVASVSAASRLRGLLVEQRSRRRAYASSIATDTDTAAAKAPAALALPGVHDALSARIMAASGAPALFLSGFGVSACRLGAPDAGILTLSEMEGAARDVISCLNTAAPASSSSTPDFPPAPPPPVIVDGDTGHGGPSNVRRTVRGLAAAGAAAVSIEDQVFPKRCTYSARGSGSGGGVSVVPRGESIERIKVALAAREEARALDGNEIMVVARTDCRAALGLDEAIARCREYEAAGADVVYAEYLSSGEEYIRLREALDPDTVTMLAQVQHQSDADRALFTLQEVGDMGYDLALFGVTALQATVRALEGVARNLLSTGVMTSRGGCSGGRGDGRGGDVGIDIAPFSVVKDAVGFPELDDFESRWGGE